VIAHVRPALPKDCPEIAANLREADKMECKLWDFEPEHSLRIGIEYSIQPLTVVGPSGNAAAIFGITTGTGQGEDATIWLLGTDEIMSFSTTFLKQSRMWIDHICKPFVGPFTGVGNWVDSRNTKHVEWLVWVGFVKTATTIKNGIEIVYYRKAI
jgi:hypothetical protein